MTDYTVQPLLEHPTHTLAFERIIQPYVKRINVRRQLTFAPQIIPNIFKNRKNILTIDTKTTYQHVQKTRNVDFDQYIIDQFINEQTKIDPDQFAVTTPETNEQPARQLLARIPLTLTIVQQTTERVAHLQPNQQFGTKQTLDRFWSVR
jgi:Uncharacterized protein, contains Trp-Asp (WD) repeat